MKRKSIIVLAALLVTQVAAHAELPELLWTRTYGLPNNFDECWDGIKLPNGDVVIAGATVISNNHNRIYVVRASSDGAKIWDFSSGNYNSGQAICRSPDNGFMVAGSVDLNVERQYIVKLDSSGNAVWTRSYDYWKPGAFRSIRPVGEEGYILAGYETDPVLSDNIILVKINQAGDTLWSRVYGGETAERAWSVRPISDGGFIVAGWTDTLDSENSNFYIIKTDSDGDSVWSRIIGGPWNDEARDIMETPDGGFVFCGDRTVADYSPDYYFMKLDSQGDSVWAHIYHGFNAVHRVIHSFIETQDGGYALIGYNDIGHIDVFKTDSEGDSLWSIRFVDNSVIRNKSRNIIQTQDGGYFITGFYQDIWLGKLSAEETGIVERPETPNKISLDQNYPNPFNASTTISFTLSEEQDINLAVYDLLGRRIEVLLDGTADAGTHSVIFDAGKYPSGIYFYRLKTGTNSETRSMVLLK